MWQASRRAKEKQEAMHDHAASHAAAGTVKDPVCGMTVDPLTAKFEANPARYVADAGKQPTAPPVAGAIYTCPMHPQIRQVGPGNCPICGMALVPEVASAATGPSAELIDMTRRVWIGLVLALPAVILEMGGHLV